MSTLWGNTKCFIRWLAARTFDHSNFKLYIKSTLTKNTRLHTLVRALHSGKMVTPLQQLWMSATPVYVCVCVLQRKCNVLLYMCWLMCVPELVRGLVSPFLGTLFFLFCMWMLVKLVFAQVIYLMSWYVRYKNKKYFSQLKKKHLLLFLFLTCVRL